MSTREMAAATNVEIGSSLTGGVDARILTQDKGGAAAGGKGEVGLLAEGGSILFVGGEDLLVQDTRVSLEPGTVSKGDSVSNRKEPIAAGG